MLNSPIVDTAVGLLTVFYALALLCAGVVELIANQTKKRAKYLLRGINDLVEGGGQTGGRLLDMSKMLKNTRIESRTYDAALAAGTAAVDPPPSLVAGGAASSGAAPPTTPAVTVPAIMGHGLVQPFKQTTATGRLTRNPSYLPADVFSRVLVDLIEGGAEPRTTMQGLGDAVASASISDPLQQALQSIVRTTGDDVSSFLTEVERWFNSQMDRITGSYKRWAKRWVLVVATAVVAIGGVDSIAIAKTLYTQTAVLSTISQTVPADLCPRDTNPATCADNARTFFASSGLPLGWTAPDPAFGTWGVPLKVLGLLLSVGAAGLGAPFWYRVLDRVGAIRNTGNRPPTTPSSTQA